MKVKPAVVTGIVILSFLLLSNFGTAATATPTPSPTPLHNESVVQDRDTRFFGVFAGTDAGVRHPTPPAGDGSLVNTGADIDPCRFDRAVGLINGSLFGWHARRTRVLSGRTTPPCDGTNPASGNYFDDTQYGKPDATATRANFYSAIDRLKPAGEGFERPGIGQQASIPGRDELVVYVSAHGACSPTGVGVIHFADGDVTAHDLRARLSGFPRGVTITVIIDACNDGFADILMGITDDQGQGLDAGRIEVLQATRENELGYGDASQGHMYTTALVDCLKLLQPDPLMPSTTVADHHFGNKNRTTSSLELHNCAGALTGLVEGPCRKRERVLLIPRSIADWNFGDRNDTITADEVSTCALYSRLGGVPFRPGAPASIRELIERASNGPDGEDIDRLQHPTFKEIGNPDKDPNTPDIDQDGISNVDEISTLNRVTNPWLPDTDGDGLFDNAEILAGCDPVDFDTDIDGIIDGDDSFCTDPVGGIAELRVVATHGRVSPLVAVIVLSTTALLAGLWFGKKRWMR